MAALLKGPKRERKQRRGFSGDPEEFRLTLVEHLEELRDRIIKSVFIVLACWVAGWYAEPDIFKYIESTIAESVRAGLPEGVDYKNVLPNMADAFFLKFKLSFAIGMIPATPLIVLQLWAFIAPGLKPKERRPFKKLAPFSALLFILGAAFCWMIIPTTMKWFVSYFADFPGVGLYQQAGTMTFFVLKMLAAFGIAFQLPLVVYALGALELLSAESLMKYWRHSTVAIFMLSAIITPSADPATMMLMAVPLVLLFSISVVLVKFVQRKKQKQREAEEISGFEPGDDDVLS